ALEPRSRPRAPRSNRGGRRPARRGRGAAVRGGAGGGGGGGPGAGARRGGRRPAPRPHHRQGQTPPRPAAPPRPAHPLSPPADAPVVARLRAAGAIVLGKPNLPELAIAFETDNLVYGRTSNPHDPGRTPGGSSGGEAAIIAVGGSPLGLGNDAGGSIRLPAHCC